MQISFLVFSLKTRKTFNLQGFSKTYCEFVFSAFFKCMKKCDKEAKVSAMFHVLPPLSTYDKGKKVTQAMMCTFLNPH